MRLTIMIALYCVAVIIALLVLYGPLRRAIDPQKQYLGRVILILVVLAALFSFSLIGALVPDGPLCWFFQKWGNIILGYVLYFFGPLVFVWIFLLFVRIIYRIRHHEKWIPPRGVSAAWLIVLLALTIGLNVWGVHTAHDVQVTKYTIDKSILGQTEPLRIVLIGDLHIGVNSTPQLYKDMVDRVNEQNPDLILIAGDIVTSSFGAMGDPQEYSGILSQMKASKGKYAVYGNHDVEEPLLGGFTYVGADNAHRHPDMPGFIKDCGWTLLTDEVTRPPHLNGLCIAGRRDESRPGDGVKERLSLAELLADTKTAEPILLLQHEPCDLDDLTLCGVDLSVSGHTHDGQIFPGNVYGRIKGPQSYGLKQWNNSLAEVTSGVGYYGPPIRVGTISEIVVIDAQ